MFFLLVWLNFAAVGENEENEGIMKRKMSDQFFSVLSSEITKRTATERKKETNRNNLMSFSWLFIILNFFSLLVGWMKWGGKKKWKDLSVQRARDEIYANWNSKLARFRNWNDTIRGEGKQIEIFSSAKEAQYKAICTRIKSIKLKKRSKIRFKRGAGAGGMDEMYP